MTKKSKQEWVVVEYEGAFSAALRRTAEKKGWKIVVGGLTEEGAVGVALEMNKPQESSS